MFTKNLWAVVLAVLAWVTVAVAGECVFGTGTFVGDLPGGGQCTLLSFEDDGFSPGPAGTALLDCLVDGTWGHYRVPASCADGLTLAGFPCAETEDGFTCYLVDVQDFHCYRFHGRTYCFERPVPVVRFRRGGDHGG